MSRSTMFAATALALGLATSATPAMASTNHSETRGQTQFSQGHDRGDNWRHHRQHRHHNNWRVFVVGGVIEAINDDAGTITIDPRRGPDRTLNLTKFTRVTRDGDRVSSDDLAVGDRAFVRGAKKHGDLWAVRVDALS